MKYAVQIAIRGIWLGLKLTLVLPANRIIEICIKIVSINASKSNL
jgi:hypothetical protein